ncbi:MAG TPA: sigma-70 family RNA polymerase sigma factor [Polyangiaceae bacterium]
MSSVVVSPSLTSSPRALAVSCFCTCSDMELVKGLVDNDPDAWRALSLRYGRLIQSCIGRVTARFSSVVRPDDAAEIYSMLCVQLLANNRMKLRSFAPERGCKLGTWLGLLATHTAYDFLRSIRKIPRTAQLAEAEELASETPDPAEVTLGHERMQHMGSLLAGFTQKDREFVNLYFGEGLDPCEVARRMGISVKTVYSKKHKIQRRLESLLGERSLAA